MRIAILGGTGSLGRRLAEGWVRAGHEVVLGSRDPAATRKKVAGWAVPCAVQTHSEAVQGSRVVVLATPAASIDEVLESLRDVWLSGTVALSVMVPLAAGEPTRYEAPPEGSIAAHVAARVPEGVAVTAGFHTVSATSGSEAGDVLLCGQSKSARDVVATLVTDLALRPVDCGPLRMAETLERLTPLLIGVNRRLHVHGAGIRITGVSHAEREG